MLRGYCYVLSVITALFLTFTARSQTITPVETGGYYTALATDKANNIYVTRYNGTNYEVAKYINGTGTPQVIYSGLAFNSVDFSWGLAVASNGDVYIAASNVENRVIRLPYNSTTGNYGAAVTFLSGNYYSALAIDADDNLYTLEYVLASDDYAIVKYPTGPANPSGTQLYHGLFYGQYPTGLVIAPNKDIYATDGFDSQVSKFGAVYKFTAASNYTNRITISSNNYSSALALDPEGNLYVSEYNGSIFVLNKYSGGTGTPTKMADLLLGSSNFFPWGIVALNSGNLYFATGDDNPGIGGGLLHYLFTPAVPASNITFSNTTATGTAIDWTNGSGSSRTVFMAAATTGTPAPVNGTTYTPNTAFGSGSQIGTSGWFSIYEGTGSNVTVTGLTAGTTYRVMVVENNGAAFYQAGTAANNPANITVLNPLPVTFGPISAILKHDRLQVNWSTLAENNNAHFEIQLSADGTNFQTIGQVASKASDGNSNQEQLYQFEKTTAQLPVTAMLPAAIALLIGLGAVRRRRIQLLIALVLIIAAPACTKNRAALEKDQQTRLTVRIIQVDKDGTRNVSKTVQVVRD